MGVSLGISGTVKSEQVRRDLLKWLAATARELDWTSRPVKLAFKKARLRSGARKSWLEMPTAQGLSLLPHFACEELPFVFVEGEGALVEEVVEDPVTDAPTLLGGIIVKTQFAGPAVHREICEVLAAVRQSFAPDLAVDDETGFFETRDQAAVERAFAASWEALAAAVQPDFRPGARFEIGGFTIEVPSAPAKDELGALSADERNLVLAAERACVQRFGGFGTTLDRSRASVTDLELAISDIDEPGSAKEPDDPNAEALAVQAGAYFGRTLAAVLGGAWKSEKGRLVVHDVGRSGLLVDPIQVARDRIQHGPPYSFVHHLGVYETIVRYFRREGGP